MLPLVLDGFLELIEVPVADSKVALRLALAVLVTSLLRDLQIMRLLIINAPCIFGAQCRLALTVPWRESLP
jgi:hypothetical protein